MIDRKPTLDIIAAALPPQLDGIGDYTAFLAMELVDSAIVTVLTAQADPAPISSVRVETAFSLGQPRSVWNITHHIEAEPPDWILLQYNPFSFGRWGLNLYLPEVMRRIRRQHPNTRIALMVHEYFAMPIHDWKFAAMNVWQRWQFLRLGQCADVIFFAMSAAANRFQRWFPRKPMVHLPVGSNIPRVMISPQDARVRLGIAEDAFVLGLFGNLHISRMLDWIAFAASAVRQSGREAVVLYIGPHGSAIKTALGEVSLIADGPLPGEEISRRFSAMDVHLTPFSDGVSTRRTTLMTGLQHGIATVGTQGCNTDQMLKEVNGSALLLTDAANKNDFVRNVLRVMMQSSLRDDLGRQGQRLYEAQFSWERIAERLLGVLSPSEAGLSAV